MRADFDAFSELVFADDGRVRKGQAKKRELIEATMRIVKRSGIAAVSKRTVAHEAGFPDSAVSYHFDSVDAMLVASLVMINDRYVAALRALPGDVEEALMQLARYIAASSAEYRDDVIAEYELFVTASRRPELRFEQGRWYAAIDEFAARVTTKPTQRLAFAAVVEGLFYRATTGAGPVTVRQAVAAMRLVATSGIGF